MASSSSDFLGSWINGNSRRFGKTNNNLASDFLGSWINGNSSMRSPPAFWIADLLTSSEVELMETLVSLQDCDVVLYTSDFLGSWINGNTRYTVWVKARVLLTSSEVELMETSIHGDLTRCRTKKTSDFLGSWINGNHRNVSWTNIHLRSSDFLGSWINGNYLQGFNFLLIVRLLTSSEVELMETSSVLAIGAFYEATSDFLGSWINGN